MSKKAIDIDVTNGVYNGINENEFRLDIPITRNEACVMIINYKKLQDKNHEEIFKLNYSNQISFCVKDKVEGLLEKHYV